MFALPGLPALAAKSRGDHPCRKSAAQRAFTGPSLLLMSQEGARTAASHSQVVQTILRGELYQKVSLREGLSGLIFVPSSVL
jgi:hypothetical protein